jgi:8-oxo-dGTP pyrophosphatase MutT (NUDIX family)
MSSSARPRPTEFSAGGVVVRGHDVVVIVPRRRGHSGQTVLALPKGHVDPGETPEQAAAREVREEAGVEAELQGKLDDVRYWYQRGGRRILKVVSFFLFEYKTGSPEDHDDEVEEARFVPFEQAQRELSYKGEREMVQQARAHLAGER